MSDSQDFCGRDYREVFLGLFGGFRLLVLWVMHIVSLCLGSFTVFLLANKKRLVLHDVVQHSHWLMTRELLHQIVRSGKDSIATILVEFQKLLDSVSARCTGCAGY